MWAAATQAQYSLYSSSNCSGAVTDTSTSAIDSCSLIGHGKSTGFQKLSCTELLPTSSPSPRPTGPSHDPTHAPTAQPSVSPTQLPTSIGAVTVGYLALATYADSSCTTATQLSVYPLGECISYSSRYSVQYFNYVPRQSSFTVGVYFDGECASLAYYWSSYVDKSQCARTHQSKFYSATVPYLFDGMMAM